MRLTLRIGLALAMLGGGFSAASALTIELKDVAADRIERQRAAAAGALPLPGTPNVAILNDRLGKTGVTMAAPMLIRIFKSESELEVWKKRDGVYVLFATYPICHWSGSMGPKLRTGDKQAPEGFYTITKPQIRYVGRWPKSLDVGFPNVYDQSFARTGSFILIHGGCSSVGCFAMTNPVMDEIHDLVLAAIESGQEHVPVHIFPFRMTMMNVAENALSPWAGYWNNLKQGYELFEKTKLPPAVSVCDGSYRFEAATANEMPGPLTACAPTLSAIRDQEQWLRSVPAPAASPLRAGGDRQSSLRGSRRGVGCSMARPSCRKFVALKTQMATKRRVLAARSEQRKSDRRVAPRS